MKTIKTAVLIFLVLLSHCTFAQCYSKIVSYSRNYVALQTDGTLWAKGDGWGGLLGFGNNNAVEGFTQIGTDNIWTDNISLNNEIVVAIKNDGTLWVWGHNSPTGNSGIGTYADLGYFGPTQVGTDNNWAKVASGSGFTLGVKTDGTLWAWGGNDGGKLGIGSLDDLYKTNVPIKVGTETNWAKVFAGSITSSAYAIKTDGTLWSWGNSGSYIGYTNANTNNNYRTPHQIGTDTWATIAVGGFPMTDGIKTDGSLWGWGSSNFQSYLFGNGIDVYASEIPVRIGNDTDWKEVCIGVNTTIGLKTNGTRWGWGRNGAGYELGMGTGMTATVTVPTQLGADSDWKHLNIDLSENYGDGIKQNNALYHWGVTNTNLIYSSPTLFSTTICTLGIDNFLENTVTAYPNPVANLAYIRLSQTTEVQAEVAITNQLGQQLMSGIVKIVNQEFTINLSSYASGIYYLTLKNDGHTFKTKLIKN